jgi:hypothetical protein
MMRGMQFWGLSALAVSGLALPFGGARAYAEGCPPIVFGAPHASLDELAVRTLQELLAKGGRYESGGFFIERRGEYQASRPVTQHARRAVNYCIVLPRDAQLAGIYHTHVASSALSPRDRSNAERAGVPSYIGTIRERSLLVYEARHREVRLLEHAVPDDAESPSLRERLAALKRRATALVEQLLRL